MGRALRAVVDRKAMGEMTITLDCDVLNADGGTRCASITGAWVALSLALNSLVRQRVIPAVASSRALLEMQFVDVWSTVPEPAVPQRRRSDIEQAAARQGKDLHKLADDFRDRLAPVRAAGDANARAPHRGARWCRRRWWG